MSKRITPFSRKLRQFKAASRKVNRLIASGEIAQLSQSQRDRLVLRLRRYYLQLRQVFAGHSLRKILAGAAVMLGIGATQAQAQATFLPQKVNPWGLVQVYTQAYPELVDIDDDGDLDMFVGEYLGAVKYFENTGTDRFPDFSTPPMTNPWGIDSVNQEFHPRFLDLDNDGDMDLFVGEYGGDMIYFQNTGTAAAPAFAAGQRNPFGLVPCNNQAWLSFPDIDNDGDFDMLAGEQGGCLQYFENIGDATTPSYASPLPNPFGLTDLADAAVPDVADLDNDGDLDLLVGEDYGVLRYFQNVGTAAAPSFAAPVNGVMGIVDAYDKAYPAFADIDGDGDLDLFVGDGNGDIQFQENNDIVSAEGPTNLIADVNAYPNPTADFLSVSVEATRALKDVQLSLYDLHGRVVAQQTGNSSFRIDMRDLSSGTYLLRIETGGDAVVRQVMRE